MRRLAPVLPTPARPPTQSPKRAGPRQGCRGQVGCLGPQGAFYKCAHTHYPGLWDSGPRCPPRAQQPNLQLPEAFPGIPSGFIDGTQLDQPHGSCEALGPPDAPPATLPCVPPGLCGDHVSVCALLGLQGPGGLLGAKRHQGG